jgi:hypothetical protein
MSKRAAYQVKFTISRLKYKNITSSGIVIATSQANAVEEARKTLQPIVDKMETESTLKLFSAIKLVTDFILFASDELETIGGVKDVSK